VGSYFLVPIALNLMEPLHTYDIKLMLGLCLERAATDFDLI
jgi:hypothetical protein